MLDGVTAAMGFAALCLLTSLLYLAWDTLF